MIFKKAILTSFIHLLMLTSVAQANILRSQEMLDIRAQPVIKDGGQFIELCTVRWSGAECKTYPENADLIFKGTTADWGYFINRCRNFETVNKAKDITMALGMIAIFPQVIGLWGGLILATGAEVSLILATGDLYPNPRMEDEGWIKFAEMIIYLTKDEQKIKSLPTSNLLGLRHLLKICSAKLSEDYINRMQSQCLQGCHSSR